jgi:hypothetical protein
MGLKESHTPPPSSVPHRFLCGKTLMKKARRRRTILSNKFRDLREIWFSNRQRNPLKSTHLESQGGQI